MVGNYPLVKVFVPSITSPGENLPMLYLGVHLFQFSGLKKGKHVFSSLSSLVWIFYCSYFADSTI